MDTVIGVFGVETCITILEITRKLANAPATHGERDIHPFARIFLVVQLSVIRILRNAEHRKAVTSSTVRGLASNLSHTVQVTWEEREFPGGLVDGTTF
jgi:hypothetical protein